MKNPVSKTGRLALLEFVRQPAPLILTWAFVGISGGCSSNEVLPAVKPVAHKAVLDVKDVIGCYELLSLTWAPPFAEEFWRRFYAPPRYFALTSDVLGDPKVRRVKAREPDYHLRMGIWQVSDKNEVEATFTDGWVGVGVVVRPSSTPGQFHGRAGTLSDGGGGPPNTGEVIFRSVPCWPEAR